MPQQKYHTAEEKLAAIAASKQKWYQANRERLLITMKANSKAYRERKAGNKPEPVEAQ